MDARMLRITRSTIAALAIGGAALIAGCGDDDSKDDAPAKPASFAIEATAQGKTKKVLEFPATVKAGVVTVTFKNSDSVPRSAGFFRLVGDHSVDDVLKALGDAEDSGPIPTWIEDGGGIQTTPPGQTTTVTQVLAPGRWGIADDESEEGEGEGKAYSELGAKGEFTVTGPASDAELPDQPATLTATDDGKKEYGFEFQGLKAGVNKVRFENTGTQLHHAIMFPINKGSSIEDVEKAFTSDAPPKGPPPVDFEKAKGTQVIDGDIAQNIELEFQRGTYAVVCFIQDRKGGKSHVQKGMIDELSIK